MIDPVDQLLTPVSFSSLPFLQGFLVVSIGAITEEGLQLCQGWLKSSLVRLLLALEACSPRVLALPLPRLLEHANENYPFGVAAVVGVGRIKGCQQSLPQKLEEYAASFNHWCSLKFVPTGFGITMKPASDAPGIKILQYKTLPSSFKSMCS